MTKQPCAHHENLADIGARLDRLIEAAQHANRCVRTLRELDVDAAGRLQLPSFFTEGMVAKSKAESMDFVVRKLRVCTHTLHSEATYIHGYPGPLLTEEEVVTDHDRPDR